MFGIFAGRSAFDREIRNWIEGKARLDYENEVFSNACLTSAADADALNAAFLHLLDRLPPPGEADKALAEDLNTLIGFIQEIETRRAGKRVVAVVMPTLERILAVVGDGEPWQGAVAFACKQFVACGYEPGIAMMADYVRKGSFADDYLWSVTFAGFAEHPKAGVKFASGLGDFLPAGFCGVAYLDFINTLCREGRLSSHPFDSAAGIERLAACLADPENTSYGVSACAALPFLDKARRAAPMETALAHKDPLVRMEAAWASAASGEESGLENLSKLARDPILASRAIAYLEELNAESRIPAAARDPVFLAQAEMADWLAHPMEFGRPPSEVKLVDRRRMVWPPAGETIDAFLIGYRFADAVGEDDAGGDGDGPDEGVGMVGSVTFALFGETDIAGLPPEDIYGLHCCWELECDGDPRAPDERTAAYGRRILAEANPGMEF